MAPVLVIRHHLVTENKRRDAESPQDDRCNEVFIQKQNRAGVVERVKINSSAHPDTQSENEPYLDQRTLRKRRKRRG
jgi:hypothetical protein